jgi:hypothetical protein
MGRLDSEPSTLYTYNSIESENTAIDSIFNELFQQLEEILQSQ